LDEADENTINPIERPVEFTSDLVHQFILQIIFTDCLSV